MLNPWISVNYFWTWKCTIQEHFVKSFYSPWGPLSTTVRYNLRAFIFTQKSHYLPISQWSARDACVPVLSCNGSNLSSVQFSLPVCPTHQNTPENKQLAKQKWSQWSQWTNLTRFQVISCYKSVQKRVYQKILWRSYEQYLLSTCGGHKGKEEAGEYLKYICLSKFYVLRHYSKRRSNFVWAVAPKVDIFVGAQFSKAKRRGPDLPRINVSFAFAPMYLLVNTKNYLFSIIWKKETN